MSEVLTEEQKQTYLDRKGVVCPFCKSQDIEGHSTQVMDGGAMQEVTCHDCGEDWTDIYKLDTIVTQNDD